MGKRCISARAVGFFFRSGIVNCRIGSLETYCYLIVPYMSVNCRIGSLEIYAPYCPLIATVNCRIGSLENFVNIIMGFSHC